MWELTFCFLFLFLFLIMKMTKVTKEKAHKGEAPRQHLPGASGRPKGADPGTPPDDSPSHAS